MSDIREENRLASTVEDAGQRTEALRRLYLEGYLRRVEFETMKSHIEARRGRAPERTSRAS